MKRLTWQLVIPLSIISFAFFTKWWYVKLSDGFTEILYGFPLPYHCPGWHTSLSVQLFIIPLVIDILVYLSTWFVLIFLINKFVCKLKVHKLLATLLVSLSIILLAGMILVVSSSDNIYMYKRDFKIKHIDAGYQLIRKGKKQQHYHMTRPGKKMID